MQHVPSSVNALKFYANVQPNIRCKWLVYFYLLRVYMIASTVVFIIWFLVSNLDIFNAPLIPFDIIFLNNIIFLLFYSRGRNVYVQFSSHQELTTMDQSQGRGDEVGLFCVYILDWKLHALSSQLLTKAETNGWPFSFWHLYFFFFFSMIFLPYLWIVIFGLSHFSRASVLNCYILYFPFSLYDAFLYLFFSLCLCFLYVVLLSGTL